MTQQSSIQILMLCSVVPASQAAQCCFSKRKQLKLERLNAAVSHHRTCWDTLVCLKPSSNCSVSQVCWPILSNNMVASARHVALAVDVSVSHVSTGRAMKRVSRQRNLSTPDTPSVVWLYRADGFDWGQTGRRGGGPSFVCTLVLLTHFREIKHVAVWTTSSISFLSGCFAV